MALMNRISRLFRADLHAVLDRIEEPDVLLKQAVREMEEYQAQSKQRLKLLNTEQANLMHQFSELEQTLIHLEDELDICFGSANDDLAKNTIKRKLESQNLISLLEKKKHSLANKISELQEHIDQNQSRLTAMQQKLEIVSAEDNNTSCEFWFKNRPNIHEDEIEVAFLREKQKRTNS